MYRDRDPELSRLIELMPASGRMHTQLISKPEQLQVIYAPFPVPWKRSRPIYINFDLLRQLPIPEQDLIVLHTVSWVSEVQWFRPKLPQAIALGGFLSTLWEFSQGDPLGVLASAGLTALAARQIWRDNQQTEVMVAADQIAIQVASRRGYSKAQAAQALLEGIEQIALIEGRAGLSLVELLRCQNLRVIVRELNLKN